MLVKGNFGMNIDEKDDEGNTPLKMANGNDIVSFLESKGAEMF
jgi:hypothetical protein